MADFFTQFSCMLDVGSPENADKALALYNAPSDDDEMLHGGFDLAIDTQNGSQLWIAADADGDPERVIAFVKCCAAAFGLSGRWGFQYAIGCSKLRLDAFGGGAHVLDLATGETIGWTTTDDWLAATLAGGDADA